ncbi:T9SS type A sorting domain-containing protein, partial [bacterium]|nr:T9SS type A sorting domain-containing protein [bacterium]
VLEEVPVGRRPRDICVLESIGRVYVLNAESEDVSVIDCTNFQVVTELRVAERAQDIDDWEEERRIYVSSTYEGVIYVLQDETTPVSELGPSEQVPFSFKLDQNYPNPFNSSTHIPFSLLREDLSDVSLRVYNLLGQMVRQLVIPPLEDGRGMVTWDGRDDAGKLVASGLYLCRLEVGSLRRTRKMILLR